MTNDRFITLKEAADLARVSKKTVERFRERHKDNPDYADAFQHRPEAKGAKYFIKESVVLRDIASSGAGNSAVSTDADAAQEKAVQAVVDQLDIKDKQLQEKDKQIENLQQSLQAEQALHLRAQERVKHSSLKGTVLALFGQPPRDYASPFQAQQQKGTPTATSPNDLSAESSPTLARLFVQLVGTTLLATLGLFLALKEILPLLL